MAPPRCTIKPSGTTISVTASVTIAMAPPNKPEVQLSNMIMVRHQSEGCQGLERSGLGTCLVSNTVPFPMFPQDARLSAKMALRGKALRVQLDLRKYAAA